MSDVGNEWRCFKKITLDDLNHLAKIAKKDRYMFFREHSNWATLYSDRFLCSALCQGAALHYVYGQVGINDLDIYNFYIHNPAKHWYAKRPKEYDFGDPKFGQSKDKPNYIGRRVDVWGRAIIKKPSIDIAAALRQYLTEGRTKTARLLSEKAVVLLEPLERLGEVVWPLNVDLRKQLITTTCT